MATQEFVTVGRRKTATARVRLKEGTGSITVNGRPFDDYFKTTVLQNTVLKPLEVVKQLNQ